MEKRINKAWFLDKRNMSLVEPWNPATHPPTTRMSKSQILEWAIKIVTENNYNCFLWTEEDV